MIFNQNARQHFPSSENFRLENKLTFLLCFKHEPLKVAKKPAEQLKPRLALPLSSPKKENF
jgi:hypothetical protein